MPTEGEERGNHVHSRHGDWQYPAVFLTQAAVTLDRSLPLDQPELATIEAQALEVGQLVADFINGARTSVDIAIYDFRLLDGALSQEIVDAVNAAAERDVTVRLAYDRVQGPPNVATVKAFAMAGGDPAPTGTHSFLGTAGFHAAVQIRAIQEEAIDPGHQIMHQKYIVRDQGSVDAASAALRREASKSPTPTRPVKGVPPRPRSPT